MKQQEPPGNFEKFEKRARSILWQQDPNKKDKDKKAYNTWVARIKDLEENVGYLHQEAVVEISREFPCLHRLFQEHDVSIYDSDPKQWGKVKSEGKEQTHRENLNWAINAAGEFLRTGELPEKCPNDAAYYLFVQARGEPKDFLTKYSAIESKSVDDEEDRLSKKASKRSIGELDAMLAELNE